jgi:hypothetical protein
MFGEGRDEIHRNNDGMVSSIASTFSSALDTPKRFASKESDSSSSSYSYYSSESSLSALQLTPDKNMRKQFRQHL